MAENNRSNHIDNNCLVGQRDPITYIDVVDVKIGDFYQCFHHTRMTFESSPRQCCGTSHLGGNMVVGLKGRWVFIPGYCEGEGGFG